MARLLDRVSTLLACLGEAEGALAVGELAVATGLPPATCTRLLKDLVRLGWADQEANRGGYRLGPRPFALAAGQPYRSRLIAAAAAPMRELVAALPCTAMLCVLRPWRRVVVWECGPRARGGARPYEDGVWDSATGRMLLAHLPARLRRRWLDHLGLPPATVWPGVATHAELVQALAAIRREGAVQVRQRARAMVACGVAVPDGAGGSAALGAWAADPPPSGLEQALRAAGAAVRAALG
jgi:DNA-binding IclR family transcriptional regulator